MDKIIFIATSWGPTSGGINAFNYSLCKTMGKNFQSHLKIFCVVPDIEDSICVKAELDYNIKLISLVKEDFYKASTIVKKLSKEVDEVSTGDRIIFIGHDVFTGSIALDCKKELENSECAIIHHMAYNEYYPVLNNNPEKSYEKEMLQRKILNEADYVIANGPKLKDSACDLIDHDSCDERICEVLPGLSEVTPKKSISNTFHAITFARIEKATEEKEGNSIIKQTNLAIASWAKFIRDYPDKAKSSTMDVVGFDKSADLVTENKNIKAFAYKYANKVVTVRALGYMENQNALFDLLKQKSVCMMLSLEEGFGLVALEAISAGVPVIISKKSGLFMALKNLNLNNYIKAVDIEGETEEPYFSDNDLVSVSKVLHDLCFEYEQARANVLELRKYLSDNGFTWECCAKTIIEHCKIKVTSNSNKTIDLKIKKNIIVDKAESRVVKCSEKFHDVKWIDRENIYLELEKKFVDQRVLFVEGFQKSGKILTLINWFKHTNISDEQIYYFECINDEDSYTFRLQVEEFLCKVGINDKAVFLLIDQFVEDINSKYYSEFITLLKMFHNLKIIIISEQKFINLVILQKAFDCSVISIGELEEKELVPYFGMYGITIQENEKKALNKIGFLPGLLEICVNKKFEGMSIVKAVEYVANNDKKDITFNDNIKKLNKSDKYLAGILSLFEIPFSRNFTDTLMDKYKISAESIMNLCKNRVVIEYGEHSYQIPAFYRSYFVNCIDEETKGNVCLDIAEYYNKSYKYSWYENMGITEIMRGIYSCKYAQIAKRFDLTQKYFSMKKIGVIKIAKKKGLYTELIPILKIQIENSDLEKAWNIYNLVHCLVITGRFVEAQNTLDMLRDIQIEDYECKIAMLRLEAEIQNEFIGPKNTLHLLSEKYSKIGDTNKKCVANSQIEMFLILLELQIGEFNAVLLKCNNKIRLSTSKYEIAVASTYIIQAKMEINEIIDDDEFQKVDEMFRKLNDYRGQVWIGGIKALYYNKVLQESQEESICETINRRRTMNECSKEYRLWLAEVCKCCTDIKVINLLISESYRLSNNMRKRFIPKEILDLANA